MNSELLKKAMNYLRENTTYPDWWLKELKPNRLIAIYFATRSKIIKDKKKGG